LGASDWESRDRLHKLEVGRTQRTGTHLSINAMRLVSAGMWYLGTLWKLPLPVAGGFKLWLENTVEYSSFQEHASIMQVFLDHIAPVQLVFLLETALAVSLMLAGAVGGDVASVRLALTWGAYGSKRCQRSCREGLGGRDRWHQDPPYQPLTETL